MYHKILTLCLTGDTFGSCNYTNEAALHHSPAPMLPPPPASAAAASAGDVTWKTAGCDDDAVVMPCQLPQQQHYTPSYNCYNTPAAPSSVPYNNVTPWPSRDDHTCTHTHCKTSTRRRNADRHKDRVITLYAYPVPFFSSLSFVS